MNIEEGTQQTFPLRIFAIFFHPSTQVTAIGGAEKRFTEVLKILCRQRNVKTTVLEPDSGIPSASAPTCRKYLIHPSFHGKGWFSTYLEWGFWMIKALSQTLSIFRIERPNVILIPNNTLPCLVLGYTFGLVFRRPTCAVVHHIDLPSSKAEKSHISLYESYRSLNYTKIVSLAKTLAFHIMIPLLRKVDATIAVSNFTAKTLKINGIPQRRIFVSGNAIDLDSINKIEPYETKKTFDGVFVGRISKEKGIIDLVEVWKRVTKNRGKAKLLIIGSGLELAQLRNRIAEAGLEDNILLRGRCSDTELFSLLKSSKVFVFPSRFEGWGIAVAEALACGLSVIAYNIPALEEVFGSCENVFLLPIGDLSKMAETVLKLLTTDSTRIGELSKEFARKFDWESVAMKDLNAISKAAFGNFQKSASSLEK
jgi:glycosyltransferase involved in cell wall biosynthesis